MAHFPNLFVCCLLLWGGVLFGQPAIQKGMPPLQTFTPAQYGNKGKIWDIATAPNGIVYMAADKGLLEYDGKTWRHFKGSKGMTRSVWVDSDSLLYTGSDLDFGVWTRDAYHGFTYQSLYPFQEVVQDINEEFWDIQPTESGVVFISSQNLYIQKQKQLVRIAAPYRIAKSWLVDGTLYLADEQQGMFRFDGFALKRIAEYPAGTPFQAKGLYADAAGLVIVTRNAGLYRLADGRCTPIDNDLSDALKAAKVFSFERLGADRLAFGTLLAGVFITDLQGHVIHRVNKYKGLPSNTILSVHQSPSGKLWLGMDYGISALDMRSSRAVFYDHRGDFGTAAAAALHQQTLYVGTNQGLYHTAWEGLDNSRPFFSFPLVPGTEGQVWMLANIGGMLLMGHDRGLFAVRGASIEHLSDRDGVWTIRSYKDYLLTGNYNGISIFEQQGGRWTFRRKMEQIAGSCNQLLIEGDNILWVNIPTFGIIRTVLSDALVPEDKQIFKAELFEGEDLRLLLDGAAVKVVSDRFQYTFDAASATFAGQPAAPPPSRGDEWSAAGYLPIRLDTGFWLSPIDNGFALEYPPRSADTPTEAYGLVFRHAEAFSTTQKMVIHNGMDIPHGMNNLHVEFIVPHQPNVQYQYRQSPTDAWSDWQTDNTVAIFGLRDGKHTLFVRAKVGDTLTEAIAMDIRILAPWYGSRWAYLGYLACAVLLVFAAAQWRKRGLDKQRQALIRNEQNALQQQAEEHRRQLMQLEQDRLQADYEQVKQQLRSKTIELANKAKENEEKNRLLLTLKEKCDTAQANPNASKAPWKEMTRLLDAYLNEADKTFEIQMDELHQEFLKKLKARFPQLSRNDLRLCVYLKIGISSKEIADILNIQPSSFYISRSRIRKKLDLGPDEKLYDFLNGI